jgi:hypothetical protein
METQSWKIAAIFILVCSLAYAADEKTSGIPEATQPVATQAVVDGDLPNGRGHIHRETFYRGNTRIMEFHQKTVAGQTKTGRIFILGDVTVYETEDDGDGRFRSVILFNDKTKQAEGFIGKRDGTAVTIDTDGAAWIDSKVVFDAKTLAAAKEQIDAWVSFWSETLGKGASTDKFLEAAKALQEKLRDSEKKKAQDER